MTKKYDNPKETICLLLMKKPLPIEKISELLYGNRNVRVNEYVRELRAVKWIRITLGETDIKQKICHVTTKCLIDSIHYELSTYGIELTREDRNKLKEYFATKGFKSFLSYLLKDIDLKETPFDFSIIKKHLALYSILRGSIHDYLEDRLNVDTATKEFQEAIVIPSGNERTKELYEFEELGLRLQAKLANLSLGPIFHKEVSITMNSVISYVRTIESKYKTKSLRNHNKHLN